jgi:cyclic pyranopterin phosphate synthase
MARILSTRFRLGQEGSLLRDRFGRVHDDLRISVTDRCNLRCTYCMPEVPTWFPRAEILSFEEIARLAAILARRGVRRLRLTGGEPLLRRDLPSLVSMLAALPGIEDLSLTTNGLLLASCARELAAAGLKRVNVSLDTLVAERFKQLTRKDALGRVLEGLDAAAAAGFAPIKVNTVLVRGMNDDEVLPLVRAARDAGWEIRFIEFMPLENGETWDLARVIPGGEVRRAIEAAWPLEPDPDGDPAAPATRFLFRDGRGAVGFINSVTEPFCANCGRLRLTSDGKLLNCLYDANGRDLKTLVRGGADDARIEHAIEEAVAGKGRGGALDILEVRHRLPLAQTMHQIGG